MAGDWNETIQQMLGTVPTPGETVAVDHGQPILTGEDRMAVLRGRSRASRYEGLDQAERDAIDHALADLANAGAWDWWGAIADHGGFRYERRRSGLGWSLWYGNYHIGWFA